MKKLFPGPPVAEQADGKGRLKRACGDDGRERMHVLLDPEQIFAARALDIDVRHHRGAIGVLADDGAAPGSQVVVKADLVFNPREQRLGELRLSLRPKRENIGWVPGLPAGLRYVRTIIAATRCRKWMVLLLVVARAYRSACTRKSTVYGLSHPIRYSPRR